MAGTGSELVMKKTATFLCSILCCTVAFAQMVIDGVRLEPPRQDGIWVRPAQDTPSMAVWGFADGIRVGINPPGRPRGLLDIYAPYLGAGDMNIINFIAMEPIVASSQNRGYSELESSALDGVQGKQFRSSDTPERPATWDKLHPARGTVAVEDGKQTLTVWIFCEKFDNGADVYVRLRFIEGSPYQFELQAFASAQSAPLDKFILTATMGNKMRLRRLYAADGVTKLSYDLWPDYRDKWFTPYEYTFLKDMVRDRNGGAWVLAYPTETEADYQNAVYEEGTFKGWDYKGIPATQYWYCPLPQDEMYSVVNGRYTYWAILKTIPGGIAFENFELVEPFRQGAVYYFGIDPDKPAKIIKRINRIK